jgi:hypothetical protein
MKIGDLVRYKFYNGETGIAVIFSRALDNRFLILAAGDTIDISRQHLKVISANR